MKYYNFNYDYNIGGMKLMTSFDEAEYYKQRRNLFINVLDRNKFYEAVVYGKQSWLKRLKNYFNL